MSQIVIYKGVRVEPVEREGGKIRVRTTNPGDANTAEIPFKDMEGGQAVFETWANEDELVAVN